MKISRQWLDEWVQSGWSTRELGDRLTMAGFELEAIGAAAPAFAGVFIAEIIEAVRHPQADKLQICKVIVGDDGAARAAPLQIVCGAANARAGLRTALATVGALLPGGLAIKAAKLRGVESAGMLCSAKELGLAEVSDGIIELPADAPLGAAVREWLALDDEVLELSVTPNRGDAMSIRGIAREVGALCEREARMPALPAATVSVGTASAASASAAASTTAHERARATLRAPASCPRFHGRVVLDVDNSKPSPTWLRERLRRAGLRSISPVVDVTNYIVIELGQPMHAYDLDKLSGNLEVRNARTGETCALLDGREVTLADDVLVIADAEGPVALAGVMGGERTSVSASTTRVLFEVAWFTPAAIAGRGRRYGLTTDASQRFERGVDPELGAIAMDRATELLLGVAGGHAGPTITVEEPAQVRRAPKVRLRARQVERLLGMPVSDMQITSALERLGMHIEALGIEGASTLLEVTAPSHRFDINIERDLIEEVARLHGYDAIPVALARAGQNILAQPSDRIEEQRLLDIVSARGYHEAIHFAFVDPELQQSVSPGVASHVIANPIASDLAVMRLSLWPGLLKAARENQRRQQNRVRLFEHGVVFPVGEPESDRIAGLAVGSRWPEQWGGGREPIEFADVRADVEAILSLTGDLDAFSFAAASHPALHPGRSAQVLREGRPVGWIGELHPRIVRELEFVGTPVLFELEISSALSVRRQAYVEVSRFPQVRRDLAIVVDEAVHYDELRERVFGAVSRLLQQVVLFDVYRGPGIESGRKSVALGLILQDKERTLTDADTDGVIAALRAALSSGLGATFRE